LSGRVNLALALTVGGVPPKAVLGGVAASFSLDGGVLPDFSQDHAVSLSLSLRLVIWVEQHR